jgi:hypothetical protein
MPRLSDKYPDLVRQENDLLTKYGDVLGVKNHKNLIWQALQIATPLSFDEVLAYPNKRFEVHMKNLDAWLKARLPKDAHAEADQFINALREEHLKHPEACAYVPGKRGTPSHHPSIRKMNEFLERVSRSAAFKDKERAGELSILRLFEAAERTPNIERTIPRGTLYGSSTLFHAKPRKLAFLPSALRSAFLAQLDPENPQYAKYAAEYNMHWQAIERERNQEPPIEDVDVIAEESAFLKKHGKALGVRNHNALFGKVFPVGSPPALGAFVKFPDVTFNPRIAQLEKWLKDKLPDAYGDVDQYINALRTKQAINPIAQEKNVEATEPKYQGSQQPSIAELNRFLYTVSFSGTFEDKRKNGRLSVVTLLRAANTQRHKEEISAPILHSSELLSVDPNIFAFYTEAVKKVFITQLAAKGVARERVIRDFDAHWEAIEKDRKNHREKSKKPLRKSKYSSLAEMNNFLQAVPLDETFVDRQRTGRLSVLMREADTNPNTPRPRGMRKPSHTAFALLKIGPQTFDFYSHAIKTNLAAHLAVPDEEALKWMSGFEKHWVRIEEERRAQLKNRSAQRKT